MATTYRPPPPRAEPTRRLPFDGVVPPDGPGPDQFVFGFIGNGSGSRRGWIGTGPAPVAATGSTARPSGQRSPTDRSSASTAVGTTTGRRRDPQARSRWPRRPLRGGSSGGCRSPGWRSRRSAAPGRWGATRGHGPAARHARRARPGGRPAVRARPIARGRDDDVGLEAPAVLQEHAVTIEVRDPVDDGDVAGPDAVHEAGVDDRGDPLAAKDAEMRLGRRGEAVGREVAQDPRRVAASARSPIPNGSRPRESAIAVAETPPAVRGTIWGADRTATARGRHRPC